MAKQQFQTLGDFLQSPFGKIKPDTSKYDTEYKNMVRDKQIFCENYAIVGDTYLIHVKIGSSSQKGSFYDVVVAFTPLTQSVPSQSLLKYTIQFFSNSPSFIYKYSSLYRLYGYMIDTLQEKIDPEFANRLPDQSNPKYELSYDKSIYMACKFLYDNRLSYLNKKSIYLIKKVNLKTLLSSIRDYDTVKTDAELSSLEKGLNQEIKKEHKKFDVEEIKKSKAFEAISPLTKVSNIIKKITAKKSTFKDKKDSSIHIVPKKKGKR